MNHERLDRILLSLHGTDASAPVLDRICQISCIHADADGGGLTRIAEGVSEVISATNPRAGVVELLQVDLGEGPCVDSFTSLRPSLEPDLAGTQSLSRWPRFAPAAVEHGLGSIFAFPLISGGSPVGAMDLHTLVPRSLSGGQIEDVYLLADLAALALDHRSESARGVDGVDLRVEAAEPWAHAAVVHHASGMVAAQLNVGVDEALVRLRAAAFALERSLAGLARDIVDRRIRAGVWSADD